jgi:hypothetical protein
MMIKNGAQLNPRTGPNGEGGYFSLVVDTVDDTQRPTRSFFLAVILTILTSFDDHHGKRKEPLHLSSFHIVPGSLIAFPVLYSTLNQATSLFFLYNPFFQRRRYTVHNIQRWIHSRVLPPKANGFVVLVRIQAAVEMKATVNRRRRRASPLLLISPEAVRLCVTARVGAMNSLESEETTVRHHRHSYETTL